MSMLIGTGIAFAVWLVLAFDINPARRGRA